MKTFIETIFNYSQGVLAVATIGAFLAAGLWAMTSDDIWLGIRDGLGITSLDVAVTSLSAQVTQLDTRITALEPQLSVVDFDVLRSFVRADCPPMVFASTRCARAAPMWA